MSGRKAATRPSLRPTDARCGASPILVWGPGGFVTEGETVCDILRVYLEFEMPCATFHYHRRRCRRRPRRMVLSALSTRRRTEGGAQKT